MKRDIWDVLFWTLLGVALLIILLKMFGVIHTPDLINYLPALSIVFAAGIAYGKLMGSIDRVYRRTDWLKNKVEDNENRIINLEKGQEKILGLIKKR